MAFVGSKWTLRLHKLYISLDKKDWSEIFRLHLNSMRDMKDIRRMENTLKGRTTSIAEDKSSKDAERMVDELKRVRRRLKKHWDETRDCQQMLDDYIKQWWWRSAHHKSPNGNKCCLLIFCFDAANMKVVLLKDGDGPEWTDFRIFAHGVWRNDKGEKEEKMGDLVAKTIGYEIQSMN